MAGSNLVLPVDEVLADGSLSRVYDSGDAVRAEAHAEIPRELLPTRPQRANPRVVKRKMSNFDVKRAHHKACRVAGTWTDCLPFPVYGVVPGGRQPRRWCCMIAAILNLNHPARTVHWHFFMMSVSNLIVIILVLVVFAVAILAPFPGHGRRQP